MIIFYVILGRILSGTNERIFGKDYRNGNEFFISQRVNDMLLNPKKEFDTLLAAAEKEEEIVADSLSTSVSEHIKQRVAQRKVAEQTKKEQPTGDTSSLLSPIQPLADCTCASDAPEYRRIAGLGRTVASDFPFVRAPKG